MDWDTKKQATGIEAGVGHPKHKRTKRTKRTQLRKAALIILIASVMLVGGYFGVTYELTKRGGCGNQSTSPVYNKAAKLMNPGQLTELKQYTGEITKIRGYDSDVNCIYPVLYYQLSVGDAPAAKSEFAKLEKAYDPIKKITPAYRNKAASISDIKQQMLQLDKTVNEFESNRTFSQ